MSQKNELEPHLRKMWCIPPKHSAEFVYHMEDVLEVYRRPLDPRYPVVCLDETFTQLIGESREPLPAAPGQVERAARPSRRATSRTPWPCARHSATSSRSANDRYRPEGGFDDRASVDGGMPPASRNHRAPTAGDTPARSAASSLDRPAAIAAQNRRRSSRRATPGRPGERDTPRPDRSERRLRVPIANPSVEALRRPLESAA